MSKVRDYFFSSKKVRFQGNGPFTFSIMLAKLTAKNQITLLKALIERIAPTEYFDVTAESELTPVRLHKADTVREKLQTLGISQHDINEAIAWASS